MHIDHERKHITEICKKCKGTGIYANEKTETFEKCPDCGFPKIIFTTEVGNIKFRVVEKTKDYIVIEQNSYKDSMNVDVWEKVGDYLNYYYICGKMALEMRKHIK